MQSDDARESISRAPDERRNVRVVSLYDPCMVATVDLRSDTVTKPTDAMRAAMADAIVGDDGYGEDPTVGALESTVAALLGKDAALFVPSGVMANQIALCVLAEPGTSIVAGRRLHVVNHEMGATPRNALAQFHLLDDPRGVVEHALVADAIEAAQHHHHAVSVICAENTHMATGGWPLPNGHLTALAALGVPVHLDGARLFNAHIATGTSLAELAAPATTTMCCLSKGLGAPVGSVLALPVSLLDAARRERKRLGGQMRQAGVLAAAGLVALDHARAARLADAVARRWPDHAAEGKGPADAGSVGYGGTNIVTFSHPTPMALLERWAEVGVLAGTVAPRVVRLVTHADLDDQDIDRAIEVIAAS
jgi:threonine aldolase